MLLPPRSRLEAFSSMPTRGVFSSADKAAEHAALAELLEENALKYVREKILTLSVLDPAMGSGHFLVNAVDHLTDGMIQRMQTWHDAHPESKWEWDPIQQLIERVRAEIRREMEGNH